MQIMPFNYIRRCPNFESSRWPLCCNSQLTSPQANFLGYVEQMRDEHDKYISELARHSNEVITTRRDAPRTDEENKELCELALRGLQLLASWTGRVIDLVRLQSIPSKFN